MVVVSVLYPKTEGSRFDHGYYMEKHVPMVRARWEPMGMVEIRLLKGTGTLEGGAPGYELVGLITFESAEQVQAALAGFGAEVLGDIPNFTNVQPVIQMNLPVG